MVRKVVMPATISVRTVVLFSLSLKSRSSIRLLPGCSRVECAGIALCKTSHGTNAFLPRDGRGMKLDLGWFAFRGSVSYSPPPPRTAEQGPTQNADEPVLSADPEGESGRGADRLASADAARRPGSPDQRRHLCLAAARLSRLEEHRAHRARGAGCLGGAGSADADHPVGRAVARKRPLRRLRPRDAAHKGPPRARHALRPDQRGDDHRAL